MFWPRAEQAPVKPSPSLVVVSLLPEPAGPPVEAEPRRAQRPASANLLQADHARAAAVTITMPDNSDLLSRVSTRRNSERG